MTHRRDALMSLAVAAWTRAGSPATPLGLRLCWVDDDSDAGVDDFDTDAPTRPGIEAAEPSAPEGHAQTVQAATQSRGTR
jgi:hypothetical protein